MWQEKLEFERKQNYIASDKVTGLEVEAEMSRNEKKALISENQALRDRLVLNSLQEQHINLNMMEVVEEASIQETLGNDLPQKLTKEQAFDVFILAREGRSIVQQQIVTNYLLEVETLFKDQKDPYILCLNGRVFKSNINQAKAKNIFELLVGAAYYEQKLMKKSFECDDKEIYVYVLAGAEPQVAPQND